MIALAGVSAKGRAERGRPPPVLANVNLEHPSGIFAILGAPKDGASLLFDVLDGSSRTTSGIVTIFGSSPDSARRRLGRVSLDAPLPESLRVAEVCDLAADIREEPRRPARERLGVIGVGALAERRVRSLAREERRAVALAIALTSTKTDALLVEEPLIALDPVAPRLVVDALRARAPTACILIATASARDATTLGDRLGVLAGGSLSVLPVEAAYGSIDPEGGASMRIVVGAAHGRSGAAALAGILAGDDAVTRAEIVSHGGQGAGPQGVPRAAGVFVAGADLARLSRAVTRAIARARVDVELVEPTTRSLDAIRAALAARAMSGGPR